MCKTITILTVEFKINSLNHLHVLIMNKTLLIINIIIKLMF